MKEKGLIVDYIVVGGGISGLAALHRVQQRDHNALLLEAAPYCGGLVRSSYQEGYLVETGPNAYLKSYLCTHQLIEDMKLDDEVIFNIPGADNRYVYRNSVLHPIPTGPISFFKTPLFSLKAKLRLLLEPFVSRAKSEEESVYHFAKRRFGEEVSTTVLDAMVSGICAGNFRKLDIFSLFPKIGLIERKFRSFLLFLILFKFKSQESDKNKKNVTFRTLKRGMGSLTQRLQERYQDLIKLDLPVISVEKIDGDLFRVSTAAESFLSKKVIMAAPANVATKILSSGFASLARELAKIEYASITTCLLGFKKEQIQHPMDGFGFLIPRNQKVRILGGLFSSGLFEGRCQDGMASIKVYIGGAHDGEIQQIDEDQIKKVILEEVSTVLNISGQPVFCKINKIDSAIPQLNLGHQKIKAAIYQQLSQIDGLSLTGNYLEGVSVNEAIRSSESID